MKILLNTVETELVVKNSRFINELFVCESQTRARELIKLQKEKYQDASHVCHAFVIGQSAEVFGMSDAGEPSGTAGRPMLDVLKGSGLTNILLTVTRYFGGTLLGTGGLSKAYSACAKSVVEKLFSENAFEELEEKNAFSFQCDYALFESLKRVMKDFKLSDVQEHYSDSVSVTGKIISSQSEEFSSTVKNLSAGKIEIRFDLN